MAGDTQSLDWRQAPDASRPDSMPSEAWTERARKLLSIAAANLSKPAAKEAFRRLRLRRETARRHGVGWFPGNASDPSEKWGLPEELDAKGRPRSVWLPRGIVVPIRWGRRLLGVQVFRADWRPGDKYPPSVFLRGGTERTFLSGAPGLPVVVVGSSLDAVLLSQEAGDLATVLSLPEGTRSLSRSVLAGLASVPFLVWTGDGASPAVLGREAYVWPTVGGDSPTAMAVAGKSLRGWIGLGLREAERKMAGTCSPEVYTGKPDELPEPPPTPVREVYIGKPAFTSVKREAAPEEPATIVPTREPCSHVRTTPPECRPERPASQCSQEGTLFPRENIEPAIGGEEPPEEAVAGSSPAPTEPLPESAELSEEELVRLSHDAYHAAPPEVREALDGLLSEPAFFALRVDSLGGLHAVDVDGYPAPSAQVRIYRSPALEQWGRELPRRQWQCTIEADVRAMIEEQENARRERKSVQKHARNRVA